MKPKTNIPKSYELKHLLPLDITKPNLFYVEILFGNPKAECRNFGICKIEEVPEEKKITQLNGKKCRATVEFFENKNWKIRFLKKSMNEQVIKDFFSGEYFIVETNNVFDLGKKKLILEKGNYQIGVLNTAFFIQGKNLV